MNILFIVRDIELGGAGKQLSMTANEMQNRGHNVGVFTYNSQIRNPLLSMDVKYIPCSKVTYSSLCEYLRVIPQIRKVVSCLRPDVIVSWRANAGCFVRLATIGSKCKVIFSERTDPYLETSKLLKIATKICEFSDGGVFQTEQAQKYYNKLVHKSIVIPNPYICGSKTSLLPIESRNKEIAFVARFFLKQKRQDVMLDAMVRIVKNHPDYKLVFYGNGEDISIVEKMVSVKKLQDFVVFKGAVSNVLDYLRKSRVLALSSDYEGIPNVVLEAFEAGTPVVSTDCSPGGVRILIDNMKNGLISPCGDSDKLANNILKILDDNTLSQKFVENAKIKLKQFYPSLIFDEWEKYLVKIRGYEK